MKVESKQRKELRVLIRDAFKESGIEFGWFIEHDLAAMFMTRRSTCEVSVIRQQISKVIDAMLKVQVRFDRDNA